MTKQTIRTYKQVTPHAAVFVWNYDDRNTTDGSDPITIKVVDYPVIRLTDQIISIKTSKSKSAPSGSFELLLAPTKNWLTKLTAGSWIAIVMCQHELDAATANLLSVPDSTELKMLGRIESVRVHVEVDQETGARSTRYIVTGTDWGNVFESSLYFDPVMRDSLEAGVGSSELVLYENNVRTNIENEKGLPTSTDNINALISFWAANASAFLKDLKSIPIPIKPQGSFSLPNPLALWLNLTDEDGTFNISVSDLINIYSGRLNDNQDYEDINEAVGIIEPTSLLGNHSLWQLMYDNCNEILNELYCDLVWDDSIPNFASGGLGGWKLGLYKRIKPFVMRTLDAEADVASGLASSYFNIPSSTINLEDVISINAGTNWRDKFNYAEVLYDQSLVAEDARTVEIKKNAYITNPESYARDGFKGMIMYAKYLPCDNDDATQPNYLTLPHWKYLLKEWYFDTHNLLNGSVTVIGQEQYIQVGQNIMIDSRCLGVSRNTNAADLALKKAGELGYLLAHVESISHEFSVNAEGIRTFLTTIQFVRGVIVDSSGTVPDAATNEDGGLDQSDSDVSGKDLINGNNLTSPSTKR